MVGVKGIETWESTHVDRLHEFPVEGHADLAPSAEDEVDVIRLKGEIQLGVTF